MSEVNFKSTFRIPITQPGVNKAKKKELKSLIEGYQNHLLPSGRQGFARVSMLNSEDASFIQKIKTIGYKIFQVFDGENVSKESLDDFIKERLDIREFSQLGKNKKAMSQKLKDKKAFVANAIKEDQEKILKVAEENAKKAAEEKAQTEKLVKDVVNVSKQKSQKEYKLKLTPVTKQLRRDEIRKRESYIELCEQYGKDFAEAVFFHDKQVRR